MDLKETEFDKNIPIDLIQTESKEFNEFIKKELKFLNLINISNVLNRD
jgi:hypothetical protein